VTDEDWSAIERTLAGDTDAYRHLVLRYQDRLFYALLQASRSREDAEEVTQEAFLQAYRQLGRFEARARFSTWLYRIAFNLLHSHRRRQRRVVSLDALPDAEVVDTGARPEADMERQERVQLVHRALGLLPDEQRSILVLRELEGFDYGQIAEALSLPPGTVRSRLHRARLLLREHLERLLADRPPGDATDPRQPFPT